MDVMVVHQLRLVSTTVALGIGLVSAQLAWMTADVNIGFIGVPIAGMLGWILAMRLAPATRRPLQAGAIMALGCTVLGAVGTALAWTGDPFAAIAFGALGTIFYGIPAFLLLSVPALAWVTTTSYLIDRHTGIDAPAAP
jgi:hypothetical protein